MPRKPLRISLVIPARNEERYIEACLQSVLAQRLPFYEIIVVDNGSSDRTADIVRSYPEVRLMHESRRGIAFARTAGFNEARGDVIARIDADVRLPDDWSQQVADFYADSGRSRTAWTGGAYFYNIRWPRFVSLVYNVIAFRINTLLTGFPTLWGSSMALPQELWNEVSRDVCLRNDIHEDLDLTMHLYQKGFPICYQPKMTVQAQMRRVRSNRHELWEYLQWWPRTLRIHGYASWWLAWLIGVLPLYCATPLLTVAEHLSRLSGSQPLQEQSFSTESDS